MATIWKQLVVLFLVCLDLDSALGEFCYTYGYGYSSTYCDYGCCGPTYNEYCCSNNAGMIVGIVIGCICFIAIVTTVVCCCIKHQGYKGRVIHPGLASNPNTANIFVMSSGTTQQTYPPTYPRQNNIQAPYPYGGQQVNGLNPAYNHIGFQQPPPYSQGGIPASPSYINTAMPQPPMPQPPAYSQAAAPPLNLSSVDPPKPPVPT